MRAVFLGVILLLVPISSANFLPPLESVEIRWSESIVTSLGEEWDEVLWDEIKSEGAYPLRVLNAHELLVWHDSAFNPGQGFTVTQTDSAVWKYEDSFLASAPDFIKIMFEPRLPSFAYHQISQDLSLIGITALQSATVEYSVMPHKVIVPASINLDFNSLLAIPGILWVEPLLTAQSRNLVASAYLSDGNGDTQPHWQFGLNGEGVVLGVADSGIDDDHSCFRNNTDMIGEIGNEHRKILVSNISLDDGDNPGESDYRHGTHVAGSLVCHDVYSFVNDEQPLNGSTISYKAKLVFQDIVSDEGWIPPDNVTDLLLENSLNGGIIHSNSWGDDTSEYTDRSGDFDFWAVEVPWSLSFIAPGNTGGQLLEPSNGRNVVAIGASTKSVNPELWPSSSVGPTQIGTHGIFAVAPGVSINSAKADGFDNSMNNALRVSSGTSMATPIAASFAGIVQQMVEQGWIMSANEATTDVNLSKITPSWSDLPHETIALGNGFTPSGQLLRSLLAIATKELPDDNLSDIRNNQSGWGVLSLDELVDFEQLEQSLGEVNLTPTTNIWIHDSFRPSFDVQNWLMGRVNGSSSTDIAENPWNGAGADGPFLQSGESWTKRLVPNQAEDLEIVMSYAAKPEPFMIDDLQLIVKLSNGKVVFGEAYGADGYSLVYNATEFVSPTTEQVNETSIGVRIPAAILAGVEWLDVEVFANYIAPGNSVGTVGVDGDRVGFALAAKGVIRDTNNWEDSDGDGLPNALDLCPNESAKRFDDDRDGCPDDSDGDGVVDQYDRCLESNAVGYDNDLDGCIDDSDNDGVGDNIDICETDVVDDAYPVDNLGCRPVDSPITITERDLIGLEDGVWLRSLEVYWEISDEDYDPYLTGARIMINQTGNYTFFPVVSCTAQEVITIEGVHKCVWHIPDDLPIFDISGYALHIQYFAQSLNSSPEANSHMIYFDSPIYFTSFASGELPSNTNDLALDSSNATRAIGWGLITIFSVALILQRLWHLMNENLDSNENDENQGLDPFLVLENE